MKATVVKLLKQHYADRAVVSSFLETAMFVVFSVKIIIRKTRNIINILVILKLMYVLISNGG